MVLTNGTETLIVDDAVISGEYVILSWGQYTRVMTQEEFNLYIAE